VPGENRLEVLRRRGVAEPVAARQRGQRQAVLSAVDGLGEGRGAEFDRVRGIGT